MFFGLISSVCIGLVGNQINNFIMKKIVFIGVLGSLLFLGASCSKSMEESMPSEVRLMEQEQNGLLAKSAGPEIEWMIYCEGSCEECEGTGIKVKPTVYECACETDCALKVARVQVGPTVGGKTDHSPLGKRQVDSLTALYGTFNAHLEHSLANRYEVNNYKISRVDVYATAKSFALKYHITNLDDGGEITLSYMKEGVGGAGYEVDCNGGCVSASAKCTERIKLGSPIVIECTCEGECKMDITPSEENELE